MPDLSMFQILADLFHVNIFELVKGERIIKKKMNYYLMLGLGCITIVILYEQFNILSYIFIESITEFVCGMLIGLGLLFELIGIYNNNHDTSFRQRKKELLFKNKNS